MSTRAIPQLTAPVGTKVTQTEARAIAERAAREGLTVSEYTRRVLLESIRISPAERRTLELQAAQMETVRLTFLAAQAGQDITSSTGLAKIERQALANAPATVERFLGLAGGSAKTA